jgi:hypothetical protein
MSVQFSQVMQAALGVVNAVPSERRAAIAEERLIHLAAIHGFTAADATRRDELWEAAAEILARVENLYHEGRLDEMLCGLPPISPAVDPLNLVDRAASRVTVGIGRENYRALAAACVEALSRWAHANPDIDVDHQPSTKLRWELGLDRPLLTELDTSMDRRRTPRSTSETVVDPVHEHIGARSNDAGTTWNKRD